MPSELQQTRYDRLIRRVGGIIGPGSKVAEALAELFPVIDVENVPAELLALAGTSMAFGGSTLTAAAAQFSIIQVFNPVDSGKIVTVTAAIFYSTVTQFYTYDITDVARPVIINNQRFVDSRLGVTSRPTSIILHESAAAASVATGRMRSAGSTPVFLTNANALAVLAPGTGFEVSANTANSLLECTFYWRERPAEASELNF